MPSELNPIVGDGIILTPIGAVPLIAYFNRATQEESAEDAVGCASHGNSREQRSI